MQNENIFNRFFKEEKQITENVENNIEEIVDEVKEVLVQDDILVQEVKNKVKDYSKQTVKYNGIETEVIEKDGNKVLIEVETNDIQGQKIRMKQWFDINYFK